MGEKRKGGGQLSPPPYRPDNFTVVSNGPVRQIEFTGNFDIGPILTTMIQVKAIQPFSWPRQGYDFSFIPSRGLQWLAVVVSATSAGICEETGFRGFMQRPLERRYGPLIVIGVSSLMFMLLHLTKGWALIGMVPIVFGAGVLLGLLAWAAGSLIPAMIGHIVMDIGLFGFRWTGIAGDFTARPISETGVDQLFIMTCVILTTNLLIVLSAIQRLRRSSSRVSA